MKSQSNDRYYNLFEPQRFSEEVEDTAIRNNMTIDYAFGHASILSDFTERIPKFREHFEELHSWKKNLVEERAIAAKGSSVLMTVIMLTGECNANCNICYTDRRRKVGELSFEQMCSVIDQTYDLGSRLVYIPGEGEPTLDAGFLDLVDYIQSRSMNLILFTNGILFSNEAECLRKWGMSSEEMVRYLSKRSVFIYHKLWSTRPNVLAEMMNVEESAYRFSTIELDKHHIQIPAGLDLLLRHFPRERVGVEVVISRQNLGNILNEIIPLIVSTGVKSYIEPILHAGRCFGQHDFDPIFKTGESERLQPWLSRQNCRRVGYKIIVHNDGFLSYGMALTASQISKSSEALKIIDSSGRISGLFHKVHTNSDLVSGRYQLCNCICEEINLRMAKEKAILETTSC